jgi:hypothetical protein
MCKNLLKAIGMLLLTNAAISSAEDLTPGLWEIVMKTTVPGSSGFAPPPYKMTQCFTANDAQDPSKIIGPIATSGASNCAYSEKNYVGNTFHFAMSCSGSYGLKTRGEVSFTATALSGTISATGNVGGVTTEFQNALSARRLGECPSQ